MFAGIEPATKSRIHDLKLTGNFYDYGMGWVGQNSVHWVGLGVVSGMSQSGVDVANAHRLVNANMSWRSIGLKTSGDTGHMAFTLGV